MGRLFPLGLSGLIAAIVVAVGVQHAHYLSLRRTAAQDRQPMLYGGEAFHVVTFVRLHDGDDLIAALKVLHAATRGGAWIYAGKVIVNVPSAQIGSVEWSGVVLAQYPSRAAYEAARAAPAYEAALGRFAAHYEQGMRRNALANLLLPQALLMRKIARAVRFTKSPYPFTPAPAGALPARGTEMIARLRAARDLGSRAAVVVNLQRRGTAEQSANDARYTSPMLGLMAERGYGPLHLGEAVALPGDYDFDRVAIVYYPGTDYFADMFASTFYQSILGDKQLGDNQSTITVPVLALVEG
jgi:hypothetical protein